MKQEKTKELTLQQKQEKIRWKYIRSTSLFVFLNIFSMFVASLTVVLTLFSVRYNSGDNFIMSLFITIAVINVSATLFVSLQSFFNITDKKGKILNNIETNKELLEELKNKNDLTQDDLDNIIATFE
ncbi:hypothetical protein H9M94_00430 [Mycoplasma sp. Pen4]|uniref:hypothetical protein n=1 Tax=Mycoplasma sp. Pen4 TaxID=640330 RepID=UPI0016541883|nr:hypothetical protein [Mycoplasma sp. Pen4]QNM93731.1 hypothetical protein H9M94_00430 [Mycoplasma sp. Pen4]